MSADLLNPTRLAERYVLRGIIATGGMGEVHLATDERLGREVAVKVLAQRLTGSPEAVERFRREALAAAGLTHPNIARVYDYGVDGRNHFIVMEYLPGRSLDRLLRERGPLVPEQAVGIASQVCAALAAAHRAGIVHRDIKPGNIMVTPDGTVKVTDFGISKALGAAPLTDTGTVMGTAAYLPPEVSRGASAGPAADLYSLGIVLYEMLTGQVPFSGETPVAIAMRHLAEDVPPPSALVPDLPRSLDAVVTRATSRKPEDRFASAEAMAESLRPGHTRPLPSAPRAATTRLLPTLPPEPTATTPAPSVTGATAASTAGSAATAPAPSVTAATAGPAPTGSAPAVTAVSTHPMPSAQPVAPAGPTEPPVTDHRPAGRNARPGRNRVAWVLGSLVLVLVVALGASLFSGGLPGLTTATPPTGAPSSSAASTGAPSATAEAPRRGVVPNGLVGTDLTDAVRAVRANGLSYQWRMVASDAPRNQVIKATPGPGTTLRSGDTVTLVVSRGNHAG